MEIFNKKLMSVDLERRLVLPNNTRTEALPFHGPGDIVIPITIGHGGVQVDVRCSYTAAGRLALTEGWVEIARNLRLNVGDVVALRREDHGRYKMTVRSGSA